MNNIFDWGFYIFLYDDLEYIKTENDAYEHYNTFGIKENRICDSDYYNSFDWEFYILLNPDLIDIKDKKKAFLHYINNGIKEKRIYDLKYKDIYNNFNFELYISLYDDIKNITSKDEAFKHYIYHGLIENRIYSNDPFSTFDWKYYIKVYPHLNIMNKEDAYKHWVSLKNKENNTSLINNIRYETYITFIIPTIGRITLLDTLQSLLNLNCNNWKAIIVYDGIKQNISIDDERIKIYEIKKCGKAGNVRNYGLTKVENSEWVAFVDDDDLLSEDYIDKLKLEKRLNDDIDVCIFRMIDQYNKILPSHNDNTIYKSRVGISFAVKYEIAKNIFFKDELCEDYLYLKELEFKKNKIVISCYVCYFVRCKIKNIERLSRILINYNSAPCIP